MIEAAPPAAPPHGAEALLLAVTQGAPLLRRRPLGVYAHIPFCRQRCHYCDFNTYALEPAAAPVAPYVTALLAEGEAWGAALAAAGARAETLFLGGGTPTFLPPRELARAVAGLLARIPFAAEPEVTVEANPGGLDGPRLDAMARAGVTRLSLGLQAWQEHHLRRLGRDHDRSTFTAAYRAARAAGFANINVDLMYGLPGQTTGEWRETLAAVVGLAPAHISCYALIVEEATPFGAWHRRGLLDLPGEDATADMFHAARRVLRGAGYRHYEVANFARPGRSSRHNTIYWRNGCWLGLGAGAHGQLPGWRWENLALPASYMEALAAGRLPVWRTTSLSPREQEAETAMLQLRLLDEGLDDRAFRRRFGRSLAQAFPGPVAELTAAGLLRRRGSRYVLTAAGLPVANRVFRAFL